FTMSYDFGLKLNGIATKPHQGEQAEPDIFIALFATLIIHDYDSGRTFIAGRSEGFDVIEELLSGGTDSDRQDAARMTSVASLTSSFSRVEYLAAVNQIKELIREGETYQANLTQQLEVTMRLGDTAAKVFENLRLNHPAPFAAYLDRGDSVVVSASPEQFLRVDASTYGRTITAAPIKGTRRRGSTATEDARLRSELLASEKDRAENTMIVDLMRNDLGRVCEFGSVKVDELCRLEEHPTLFHLVSTIHGSLLGEVSYSDIIRAVFPCGSITGAPKMRTMEIIDRLEPSPRGLSMGAIGCRIPDDTFGISATFEMSVAIRTMVIRDMTAVFNVGGGIVIDSNPELEYEESMLKAKALLHALRA
ncbi:MAG: aminodeoxychorismate synthase component I, partial [Acidobacteriota bacterium]